MPFVPKEPTNSGVLAAHAQAQQATVHIRRPLKQVGRPGYRNRANADRYAGTYCGGEPTAYDLGPKDAATAILPGYALCPACLAARETLR